VIELVLAGLDASDTPVTEIDRRAGDPAFLCADVSLAKTALKFESQYSLEESIASIF
jgi:UDP-glucose 4-epimerase